MKQLTKSNKMTEIEKLRKELNDRLDSFENKPKYEVGKWSYTKVSSLFFIEKINVDMCYGYGLSHDGIWFIGFVCLVVNIKRLATEFEVAEMLKKEAIKRGLVKGAKFKSMDGLRVNTLHSDYYYYYLEQKTFSCDYKYLMQNGIWAVPIKEKTSEEWGEEFLEFYKKSKNQSLAEAFGEFITKHNFKLPT